MRINIFGHRGFATKSKRRQQAAVSAAIPSLIETLEGRVFLSITATPAPFSVIEGNSYSGAVATFTDSDVSPIGDYSATIDWGDGAATTAGTITLASGQFTVNGTHTYSDDGHYNFTVNITESNGADNDTAAPVGVATVGEALLSETAVNFSGIEGVALNNQLTATFNDPGSPTPPSNYEAVINWGDGSPLQPGIITGNAGSYSVLGSHTYAVAGVYTVTTTSDDKDDPGFTISVGGTATIGSAFDVSLAGPSQPIIEGGMLVYNFTIKNTTTDPETNVMLTDVLPANASFSFGGATQGGAFTAAGQTVSANLGTLAPGATVTGSIVAQALEEGIYTNTIGASDDILPVASADQSNAVLTTVLDAPLTPTAASTITGTEGKNITATLGSFKDADPNAVPSDYTATIDWGDGQTSIGTIVPNKKAGFDVKGTHAYLDSHKKLPITVTVRDEGGSTCTINATGKIADAPLTGFGKTLTEKKKTDFTCVVASFCDANTLNTDPGEYTGTVYWGDGSKSAATFVYNASTKRWDVIGSHKYAKAGTYKLTIAVTDEITLLIYSTAKVS